MAAVRLRGPTFHPFLRKAAKMSTSALSAPRPLNTPPHTMPNFLYGTAWKKERTADLVYEALKAGFKGVDTAAQPRHYNEGLVGDGIRRAIDEGLVKREDIFIQTKYTPISGQDPSNLPYDPSSPIPAQIHASIASSLSNLSTGPDTYLDSLVLHSPLDSGPENILAIQTLNTYVASGKIRQLGIANVPYSILATLIDTPGCKLAVVQNRFYGRTAYDVRIRELCKLHGIVYQSFWTLTGNPELLQREELKVLSQKAGVSREVALYALVMGLEDITVLNGTTNKGRMVEDLEGVEKVGQWAEGSGSEEWTALLNAFRIFVGDFKI